MIDVVIVTADTREMTSECVAGLEHERDLERVIVVDNASSDGTQDALRERFPAVAVARLDEGVGSPAPATSAPRTARPSSCCS